MTTLDLDLSSDDATSRRLSEVLKRLAAFVGTEADDAPQGQWTVTVMLTDDQQIAELHDRFFGDPSATDVITFPFEDRGDAPFAVGQGTHGATTVHLGDVVVSIHTAAANAMDVGHPIDREIAFLMLHGLLHLFGYVDDTHERRSAMLVRQEELLSAFEACEPVPWW